ncbi:MAG: lipase secretion chaperone, partial [Pseudomonas sp.]
IYLPVIAASLLLGWHFFAPQEASSPPPAMVQTQPQSPQPLVTAAAPSRSVATPPTAGIDSLRDTEVDGDLQTDASGNLIVTEELRHLFDYFYTAVGEIEFDQATARIRQYLASQLRNPALSQANALLDSYIAYKTELVDLESNFPVIADIGMLRDREDAVQRLRATLFTPEAHRAFFATEELYNGFTLERLAILHDANIPEQDKGEMIEALRENLPEEVQAVLIPQIHQTLTEETDRLLAEGAGQADIRQLRLSLVGPEATQRLEQVDHQRAQWQQRLDAFSADKQAILDFQGLADEDKQSAIDELLQERFSSNERLRVATLLDMSED